MTKQLVTGMAGDPNYRGSKQGEKKDLRETCAKDVIHYIFGLGR